MPCRAGHRLSLCFVVVAAALVVVAAAAVFVAAAAVVFVVAAAAVVVVVAYASASVAAAASRVCDGLDIFVGSMCLNVVCCFGCLDDVVGLLCLYDVWRIGVEFVWPSAFFWFARVVAILSVVVDVDGLRTC